MDIKNFNQISSKKGDSGDTKDYSNRTFKKSNILFETLGTMDELSSNLGLAYHYVKLENILRIQNDLQKINSIIATDPNSNQYNKLAKLENCSVEWIESEMQKMLDLKPLQPRFTLPGSEKTLNGAYMDIARTISRKAERRLIELVELHEREDLDVVQSYVNRLSDYLYVLSCNLD